MIKICSKVVLSAMTVDQVLQDVAKEGFGYYKYVCVGGEYRFCDATTGYEDHKSLANGQPAESAATVKVYPDGIKIEGYSSTLRIGPSQEDYDKLPKLFGLPIKEDRWY